MAIIKNSAINGCCSVNSEIYVLGKNTCCLRDDELVEGGDCDAN